MYSKMLKWSYLFFLLSRAQQFGDQMQQTNPELFNQMRSQAHEAVQQSRNPDPPGDQDPEKGQDNFLKKMPELVLSIGTPPPPPPIC